MILGCVYHSLCKEFMKAEFGNIAGLPFLAQPSPQLSLIMLITGVRKYMKIHSNYIVAIFQPENGSDDKSY